MGSGSGAGCLRGSSEPAPARPARSSWKKSTFDRAWQKIAQPNEGLAPGPQNGRGPTASQTFSGPFGPDAVGQGTGAAIRATDPPAGAGIYGFARAARAVGEASRLVGRAKTTAPPPPPLRTSAGARIDS